MKKISCKSITVFLISAMFIFSSINNAYAAGVPGRDEAYSSVCSQWSNVEFSNYYIIRDEAYMGGNGLVERLQYCFVTEDTAGGLFCYDVYDSYDGLYVKYGRYINGEFISETNRFVCCVSYLHDGSFWALASGSGNNDIINNSSDGSTKFFSFDTNIPYFSSIESAKAYYEAGDTSGFKNLDKCLVYDSGIETPKDLKITYSTNKLFNDDGSCDAPDFKFEWKQSEDVDLSGYKTEIYMQCTLVNPNLESIIKHDYSDSKLSNKIELETVNTQKQNSVICKWENYSTALYDESVRLHGYTPGMAIVVAPMYFWVRNVKGNVYGDWVKVKVTRDNVVESGSTFNGEGTVTGGYEKIDGGSGEQKDDGEYGNSYHVDVEYKNVTSIIDYIKNGFGLLGDTGLIAMIKDVFSFLPAPIWTLLITTFSVCCLIIIWKVIK